MTASRQDPHFNHTLALSVVPLPYDYTPNGLILAPKVANETVPE